MSKIRNPLMSMDARGGVGKNLIFSGWKGIKTARALGSHTDAKTPAQLAYRAIVSSIMAQWQLLPRPPGGVDPYLLLIKSLRLPQTLYNYFLGQSITSVRQGLTLFLCDPPTLIQNIGGSVSYYVPWVEGLSCYIQYGYSPNCLSYRAVCIPGVPAEMYLRFELSGLKVGKTLYWRYYSFDPSYLIVSGIYQAVVSSSVDNPVYKSYNEALFSIGGNYIGPVGESYHVCLLGPTQLYFLAFVSVSNMVGCYWNFPPKLEGEAIPVNIDTVFAGPREPFGATGLTITVHDLGGVGWAVDTESGNLPLI
jgi:hypothetical protein